MQKLAADDSLHADMSRKGIAQAETYSIENVTADTVTLYRTLLEDLL